MTVNPTSWLSDRLMVELRDGVWRLDALEERERKRPSYYLRDLGDVPVLPCERIK